MENQFFKRFSEQKGDPMNIYEKIKFLSKQRGVTIAELERTLHFGNSTIRKWEKQSPSVDRLHKVSNYFNVSISMLLNEQEDNYASELSHFILLQTSDLKEELQAYLIQDFKDYLEFKTDKVKKEQKD